MKVLSDFSLVIICCQFKSKESIVIVCIYLSDVYKIIWGLNASAEIEKFQMKEKYLPKFEYLCNLIKN